MLPFGRTPGSTVPPGMSEDLSFRHPATHMREFAAGMPGPYEAARLAALRASGAVPAFPHMPMHPPMGPMGYPGMGMEMLNHAAFLQAMGPGSVTHASSLSHLHNYHGAAPKESSKEPSRAPSASGAGAAAGTATTALPGTAATPAVTAGAPARSGETKTSTAYASRHQAAEQRRRNRINERLDKLREIVPHSERANTAVFLEEVLRYIFRLERDLFAATQSHPRHGSEWTDAIEDAEAKVGEPRVVDLRPGRDGTAGPAPGHGQPGKRGGGGRGDKDAPAPKRLRSTRAGAADVEEAAGGGGGERTEEGGEGQAAGGQGEGAAGAEGEGAGDKVGGDEEGARRGDEGSGEGERGLESGGK